MENERRAIRHTELLRKSKYNNGYASVKILEIFGSVAIQGYSMSNEDDLDISIREMRRRFLVPPDAEAYFLHLEKLIEELDGARRAIAKTFKHNLASALSAVAIPFALASASVHQTHFQRIHIGERIRARSIEPDSIKPGEQLEEVRQRVALRQAMSRMKEFSESEDGKNIIIRDVCNFLHSSLSAGELEVSARELINQGVILIWSAFEVLFRDIFEFELNLNPSKAVMLAQQTSTRKRFAIEKLSLDILSKYDFNLSNKIGTVLVSQQDFSDLPTIKSVSSVVWPSCARLTGCLDHADLWLLYQRRHLFVHRRGMIDQAYLDNTGEALTLGMILEVLPNDFEKYLSCVLEAGEALLAYVQRPPTF